MKSGGGSGSPPRDVQPNAQVTPYGQASQFNPQYQSVLPIDAAGAPNNLATSQLGDPTRMEAGPPTPLLQQQQAQPIATSAASASDPKRDALAMLMRVFGAGSMGPGLSRGGGDRGSSGYSGSASGGPGGFGGSSARGGRAY